MRTHEFVNHPSEFKTKLLRDMISEPPMNKTDFSTDFYYLAVFDKNSNFPGDKYKALLKENFVQDVIVDAVQTMPSRLQHGFGTDQEDVTVDTWTFIADGEDGSKPEMAVVTLINVTSVIPSPEEQH